MKNMSASAIKFCLIIPEYKVYNSDESFFNNIIINSTVNIVFAILSSVLNISVILAIYFRKRLWTPYYLTLLCLAVTDFTAGFIAQPLHTIRMLLLVTRKQSFCVLDVISVGIGYSLLAVSFFTVSYVTMERYLAVFHPFYHEQRCKRRNSCKWLLSIWLFGMIYGGIGSLPYKAARTLFMIMVSVIGTICLFGNGFAYVRIFMISSKIRRRIRKEQKRFIVDEKIVKEANAAKTTCIIVSSLFIFYGPAFITTAIGESPDMFPNFINIWAYTFMLMNSTANPVVYCYFCKEISNEMKRLWNCLRSTDGLDCGKSLQDSIGLVNRNKQTSQPIQPE